MFGALSLFHLFPYYPFVLPPSCVQKRQRLLQKQKEEEEYQRYIEEMREKYVRCARLAREFHSVEAFRIDYDACSSLHSALVVFYWYVDVTRVLGFVACLIL